MRNRLAAVLLSSLLGLLPFVSLSPVRAQDSGNGFKISPVLFDLTLKPGESRTIIVNIENPTESPLTAKAIINDLSPSGDESGRPRIVTENAAQTPANSLRRLLLSQLSDILLKPKENKSVQYTITIPQDAAPGGYYGAIRFSPVITDDQSNVALTASVATLILIKVPGQITEQVDIVQLGASNGGTIHRILTGAPDAISIRVKNSGNIHEQPFGKIRVTSMLGKQVLQSEINNTDPRGSVLPDSIRRFDVPVPKHVWFGRYKVTASIAYIQGGNTLDATSVFWVLPANLILGAIVVLLLLILGLPRAIRAYNRRVISRAGRR